MRRRHRKTRTPRQATSKGYSAENRRSLTGRSVRLPPPHAVMVETADEVRCNCGTTIRDMAAYARHVSMLDSSETPPGRFADGTPLEGVSPSNSAGASKEPDGFDWSSSKKGHPTKNAFSKKEEKEEQEGARRADPDTFQRFSTGETPSGVDSA